MSECICPNCKLYECQCGPPDLEDQFNELSRLYKEAYKFEKKYYELNDRYCVEYDKWRHKNELLEHEIINLKTEISKGNMVELRDQFAMAALTGLTSRQPGMLLSDQVYLSYQFADAMLEERKK